MKKVPFSRVNQRSFHWILMQRLHSLQTKKITGYGWTPLKYALMYATKQYCVLQNACIC